MRTTESKNQNNQLPTQVAAEIIKIVPVDHEAYFSPKCLIEGNTDPCKHKYCSMAFRKPQYFGHSVAEFYNKHPFSKFRIFHSSDGYDHIIPARPMGKNDNSFEIFRQSMNAVTLLAGLWPLTEIVSRNHVVFKYIERLESYPVYDKSLQAEWRERLDVAEYAFYVGPTSEFNMVDIDVNKEIEYTENLKGGATC